MRLLVHRHADGSKIDCGLCTAVLDDDEHFLTHIGSYHGPQACDLLREINKASKIDLDKFLVTNGAIHARV